MPTAKDIQPFYITGLPRSRTAWLSVALADWRTAACLHEPLVRMESFEADALSKLLAATRCPFAGISDSGLPVLAPDLPTVLPGPVLVVWRDPAEVVNSLHAYLGGGLEAHAGGVAMMADRLDAFCGQHADTGRLLYADFDDLASMDTMRTIWQHLLPTVPFQRRRIEALQRLRIDPDPNRLLEGANPDTVAKLHALNNAT